MPPDFGLLPEPTKKNEISTQAEKIDEEIENLLKKVENSKSPSEKDNSAEDFVLKQITKN